MPPRPSSRYASRNLERSSSIDDVDDEPREVVLRQPVVDRRRHQELLSTIYGTKLKDMSTLSPGNLRTCGSRTTKSPLPLKIRATPSVHKAYPAWSPRWESNPRPTPYQDVGPNGSGCIFESADSAAMADIFQVVAVALKSGSSGTSGDIGEPRRRASTERSRPRTRHGSAGARRARGSWGKGWGRCARGPPAPGHGLDLRRPMPVHSALAAPAQPDRDQVASAAPSSVSTI